MPILIFFPICLNGMILLTVSCLTFMLQSLSVQSKLEVRKYGEKSICPGTLWQSIPVMGPICPSKASLIPVFLLQREKTFISTLNASQKTNVEILKMHYTYIIIKSKILGQPKTMYCIYHSSVQNKDNCSSARTLPGGRQGQGSLFPVPLAPDWSVAVSR